MQKPAPCRGCTPDGVIKDTLPLADARNDLELVESCQRKVRDITAALRFTLSPEDFRLVWELRDAEETLGLAETGIRQRQLVDALAHHLPSAELAIRAAASHVIDEVGLALTSPEQAGGDPYSVSPFSRH
jgi:hypothetical protein